MMISLRLNGGEMIEVHVLKHRWSRSLRLSVRADGTVRVTMPKRASLALAEQFVAAKRDWILRAVADVRAKGVMTGAQAENHYALYREAAENIVKSRVPYFAQLMGVTYKRLSVRNQKTRWGSCSRAGTLSFNYRIACIAPELADYLIVHELAHVRHFDHSRAFWAFVRTAIPNAMECRRALRKHPLR
jgi:predicted metal-dependent hydrolase